MPIIDLYYMPASAPCRANILLAQTLGVDLNKKFLNLLAGEQNTPEYLKLNPQHTIPTIVDNGFVLWESRAILGYLANQYGKDSGLYPVEPKARAKVDQRLYFDADVLYGRFSAVYYPHWFVDAPLYEDKIAKLNEAIQWLDDYLGQTKWVAGDQMTIADFSIIASITTFQAAEHDLKSYANITRWCSDCKAAMPGFDESYQGTLGFFEEMRKKKQSQS